MNLDVNFVIAAGLIIACLIPLYIYRKKIFKPRKRSGDFNLFLKDLKLYLKDHHPKINFDFSIFDKTKDEQDIKIREAIIVEDLVSQFFYAPYEKHTQAPMSKEKLWSGYDEKSASNPKLPNDWAQRKELVWHREHKKCNRCGENITLFKNAYTQFVKEIENGGGYNVENIILVCQDCNQVINSQNPKNTISTLSLHDKLMIFVKS